MPPSDPNPDPNPDLWRHRDGTPHSAQGPLGCMICANERRAAIARTACPDCGAASNEPCHSGGDVITHYHQARILAALR